MKTKTTKILVISPYFYPHTGGSENYIEELYVHVRKHFPLVHVDLICYNTENIQSVENYHGFTVYRVPAVEILPDQFALPNYWELIKLLRKLASNRYDFVHTQIRFFDAAWWTWAYAKIIKAKSIITDHVANHPVHKNKIVNALVRLVDQTIAAWSLSRYDYVLASSAATKAFVINQLHYRKPVTLVYGGVNTDFYKPARTKSKQIAGTKLPANSTIISFTGRLIWSKGVTFLYDAIKQLNDRLPSNTYFVFAGPGQLQNKLTQDAIKDDLNKRIIFTGKLTRSEIRSLLRNTDIYTLPTFHSEGIPNGVLEAGATGCFVITTAHAGNVEVITDRKNGLFVKPKNSGDLADKIVWGLQHSQERKNLGNNLYATIRNSFSWNQIARDFSQNVLDLKK